CPLSHSLLWRRPRGAAPPHPPPPRAPRKGGPPPPRGLWGGLENCLFPPPRRAEATAAMTAPLPPTRPVENAPYQSVQHAGLTIEGYSRAAVQSYWRIPELKLGFDLGAQPWDFMGTPTWFVTHTHLDHVAPLPVYVARRRMMRMEPPTLYVPAEAVDDVRPFLLSV